MKVKKGQLTERQRLFCEHYVGAGRHCAALAARLAGYAPGCSHVTGCQLLKQPKIAATVRVLEDAVAQDIRVSRQAVIDQLVAAAEAAKLMQEPSQIVNALKNVAQICGYYRQEAVKPAVSDDGQVELRRLNKLSDADLLKIVEGGRTA
jgi:phage terminase small subunit